jgi:hypothetical protein
MAVEPGGRWRTGTAGHHAGTIYGRQWAHSRHHPPYTRLNFDASRGHRHLGLPVPARASADTAPSESDLTRLAGSHRFLATHRTHHAISLVTGKPLRSTGTKVG